MGKGLWLFIVFWLLMAGNSFAQKQDNIWYFGNVAGLNFNTFSPQPLHDCQLATTQGTASIADKYGNLLFYCDGVRIWDKSQKIMDNGEGLSGSTNATQQVVILPQPGDSNKYYLFTHGDPSSVDADDIVPDHDEDDYDVISFFAYSIVDIRKNNGKGSVILKNDSLLKDIHGGIGLARCKDGTGYWVVAHTMNPGSFYAYKLSSSGVANPVISNSGGAITSAPGYIKISPDGTKLALTIEASDLCLLFDFDNDSGKVRSLITKISLSHAYGIEFSPDNRMLYISGALGSLVQYQISSKQLTTIFYTSKNDSIGALQLGTDMKIYCANVNSQTINVINNPNRIGTACNFKTSAVNCGGVCEYGLPSFLLDPITPYVYNDTCFGSLTHFNIIDSANIDSISWNFDDAVSGSKNISNLFTVNHIFTKSGKYTVNLKIYSFSVVHIYNKIITIDSPINLNIHSIKTQCDRDSIILNAYCKSCSYSWQDGSKDSIFVVYQAGKYWVTVIKRECVAADSVIILHNEKPVFSLGHDSTMCEGQFKLYSININNSAFLWQDGKKTATYLVAKPGLYSLNVSNDCGSLKDSVKISYNKLPALYFGQDTFLCAPPDFWLDATNDSSSTYVWQDGSAASNYHITADGLYSVSVTNRCGSLTKSVNVHSGSKPSVSLNRNISVCDSGRIVALPNKIDSGKYANAYLWNNGISSNHLKIYQSGLFSVTVSNYCGSITDSVNVIVNNCDCRLYVPNTFTPNRDSLNEVFKPSFCVPRSYMMRIFNRWGEQIFEAQDINSGWDGRFRGVYVPEGEYLYVIHLQNNYGVFENRNGLVLVLRR